MKSIFGITNLIYFRDILKMHLLSSDIFLNGNMAQVRVSRKGAPPPSPPPSYDFFQKPLPPKLKPPMWGTSHLRMKPPHLKNKPPPMEAPFHEMIPRKNNK